MPARLGVNWYQRSQGTHTVSSWQTIKRKVIICLKRAKVSRKWKELVRHGDKLLLRRSKSTLIWPEKTTRDMRGRFLYFKIRTQKWWNNPHVIQNFRKGLRITMLVNWNAALLQKDLLSLRTVWRDLAVHTCFTLKRTFLKWWKKRILNLPVKLPNSLVKTGSPYQKKTEIRL